MLQSVSVLNFPRIRALGFWCCALMYQDVSFVLSAHSNEAFSIYFACWDVTPLYSKKKKKRKPLDLVFVEFPIIK